MSSISSQKFERLPAVLARVGLSRSALYRLVDGGKFPRPVKLGERAIAWDSRAVDRWIKAKIAEAA